MNAPGSSSPREDGARFARSVLIHDAPGAREWLLAAGFAGEVRPVQTPHVAGNDAGMPEWITVVHDGAPKPEQRRVEWQPRTFKEVLSRALALGAAAGCQAGMMRVIAEGEARLAALRDRLGIDRKAGPDRLVPCEVLLTDGQTLPSWVPDLVDRAAGRPPRHEIQEKAHIVRLGPDILIPGPHLYDVVLRIARELHPNRMTAS